MKNDLAPLLYFLLHGATVGGAIGAACGAAGGMVLSGFVSMHTPGMAGYWVGVLQNAGMNAYFAGAAYLFLSVTAYGVAFGVCLGLVFWLIWLIWEIGKR